MRLSLLYHPLRRDARAVFPPPMQAGCLRQKGSVPKRLLSSGCSECYQHHIWTFPLPRIPRSQRSDVYDMMRPCTGPLYFLRAFVACIHP
jgi:hypothetical protein